MENLPAKGTRVQIIDADPFFKHYINKVGEVGDVGKSGNTVMVGVSVGMGVYFTAAQLSPA